MKALGSKLSRGAGRLSGVIWKWISQLTEGHQSSSCCSGCILVGELAGDGWWQECGRLWLRLGCDVLTIFIKIMDTTLGMGGK